MRIPFWLLRLLPMWDYVCPACKKNVEKSSEKCPHCEESYGSPLRIPPTILKDKKRLEDYVHRYIFPRISKAQRDYLVQYFTELFSDGFESGDFSEWTGTSESPAVVEEPHCGTYSVRRDSQGDRAYAYLPSSYSIVYFRIYWKTDTLPSTDTHTMPLRIYNSEGISLHLYYEDVGGTKRWRLEVSETGDDDIYEQTVSTNTWYCIEVCYDATNDIHKLWIDDVERISFSSSVSTLMGRVSVGNYFESDFYSHNEYIDCVVVADTYLGPESEIYTKTWTTDTLFKKLGITKSLAADTAFQKRNISETAQVDVLFKKLDLTNNFGLDAHFGLVEAGTYTKTFGVSAIFAYKVRLPELWLDENGNLVLNISKPYTWVGT